MNTVFHRLGPYEVLHEIGRGGMALVVLAKDTRTEKNVALKLADWSTLGSDAETVLRTAPAPLLLVRDLAKRARDRAGAYAKILVPVDGSDASKRGLREAARIASASRATLRLLHVVNELIVGPEYLPLLRYEGFLTSLREEANAILNEASVAAREVGAACETVVLETLGEEAAQSIVRQAQEWEADLIVMGTHGRRGLRRLALGSDAETVLRHAPAPLLLVRGSSDDE